MDISRILGIALRLVDDLEVECKRIQIAGSLRRGKSERVEVDFVVKEI